LYYKYREKKIQYEQKKEEEEEEKEAIFYLFFVCFNEKKIDAFLT